MNLLEKIENTILGHSVDEILFSNLKHFYSYENSGEVSYEKLSSKFAKENFNELNETLNYFKENILDIQSNFSHYKSIYKILADEISKETYAGSKNIYGYGLCATGVSRRSHLF